MDWAQQVHAEVTFHLGLKDVTEDEVMAKVRQIDEDNGNDETEDYTVGQALQVLWHEEPEWVHTHLLWGWTLDRTDESGDMALVWGQS